MRIILGVALLLLFYDVAQAKSAHSDRPVILFPGFASTRLIAWKKKNCHASDVFDVHVGDRVWLDVRQVAFQKNCWVECMMLADGDQNDPLDCKLRPGTSIEAISELDPGAITGPLSAIFRACISELATHFDYDTSNLQAVPYDFRIPPSLLEKRDRFFTLTKRLFEDMLEINGEPAVVIAHSMGNNVFRYFTNWLNHSDPLHAQNWIDKHIFALFAVGPPNLGSTQALRSAISGLTFGLPITEAFAKRMSSSFGSQPWMFPRPSENAPLLSMRPELEWPYHLVQVTYHELNETKTYSPHDVMNGSLWKDLGRFDADANKTQYIIRKYYENDPIFNPLTPPPRPPVRNVYVVYGVNVPTEIGYIYETAAGYPFSMTDIVYEDADGQIYKKPTSFAQKLAGRFTGSRVKYLSFSKNGKSGDGTVPYTSLSWSHTWHKDPSKILETHEARPNDGWVSGWFGVDTGVENIYRTESSHQDHGHTRKTTVIEFDNVNHREIIKSPKFLSLLVAELVSHKRLEQMENKMAHKVAEDLGESAHVVKEELKAAADIQKEQNPQLSTEERTAERVTELIMVDEQKNLQDLEHHIAVPSIELRRHEDECMRQGDAKGSGYNCVTPHENTKLSVAEEKASEDEAEQPKKIICSENVCVDDI